MAFGGLAALAAHHYWVAATDRQLVLLKMTKVGTTPVVEHAVPRAGVQVDHLRRTLMDVRLELAVGRDRYPLRFPLQYKRDGEAIAAALGGAPARV